MEISDNMVLYVVIGAVLITLIIVTRGEFIWRFLKGMIGLFTWISGAFAVLAFLIAGVFIAIPDPTVLELWMAGLGAFLTALAKFAHTIGKTMDPPGNQDTRHNKSLEDDTEDQDHLLDLGK